MGVQSSVSCEVVDELRIESLTRALGACWSVSVNVGAGSAAALRLRQWEMFTWFLKIEQQNQRNSQISRPDIPARYVHVSAQAESVRTQDVRHR